MAGRVHIQNFHGRGDLSDRDYTEYQVMAIRKADRPDWAAHNTGVDDNVMLSVYEDVETGLLVTDIPTFEQFIRTVPTFRKGTE